MQKHDDVAGMLPVRPTVLSVLIALRHDERNGYEILEHVASTQGLPSFLGPGSLYRTLKEMRESGLIEYRTSPGGASDGRLRYHGLTGLGRRILDSEIVRLRATFDGVARPAES